MKLQRRLAVSVAFLVASTPAMAFIDPPTIEPPHPTAGLPISLHVRAGGCHGFEDHPHDAELVVVSPGRLQLIVDGSSLAPGDPFCNYPAFTYRFEIGPLAPRSYELELLTRDPFHQSPVSSGNVSFTVSAAWTIPATTPAALVVLGWLSIAFAAGALRHACRAG